DPRRRRGGTLVAIAEQPPEGTGERHGAHGAYFVVRPDADQLRELAILIDRQQLRLMVSAVFELSALPDAFRASGPAGIPARWSSASPALQAADQPPGEGCTAGPGRLAPESQDTEAEGQLTRRDHVGIRAQRGDDCTPRGAVAPLVEHGRLAK